MDKFMDDKTIYRKKSNKKRPKKSDHKHEYELIEKEEWVIKGWFTHKEVCKICGKVNNELKIETDR